MKGLSFPVALSCQYGNGYRGFGFTLVEVLIALAILTVGSTAIIALYGAALETYRRSELIFISTELGWEGLATAEEILASGAPPGKVSGLVARRVQVPPAYRLDVTGVRRSDGSLLVSARVIAQGRGRSRTWTWERVVFPGSRSTVLKLPAKAPRRYVIRAGRR